MRFAPFVLFFAMVGCGRSDLETPVEDDGGMGDSGPVNEGGACPMGQIRCNNTCVDENDPNNCGTCGNKCAMNAACKMGICTPCPSGFGVCNGACTDLQGDAKNCGK